MKRNRGSILAGTFLILVGLWLMADRLGVKVPAFDQIWPGLIILGGVWSLVNFTTDRQPDQLFWAVAAVLVGGFFLLFTLFHRFEWPGDLRIYWPVFILIFSVASIAEWLAAPARRSPLYMAGLSLLVGLFFLAFNLNLLSPVLGRQILQLWPISLILLGLIVMARAITRNRSA